MQTWFTKPIFRGALDKNGTKQQGCLCLWFSVVLCMFALNGWIAGCGSLPAWIRSTRGVSLLWGLCEALWGRRLVSGCMFPIGCFCWAKTQWGSGFFKEAVSLLCVCVCMCVFFPKELFVWCWLYHIWLMEHSDELISDWWLIILCGQNKNGIWMPVLSKEQIFVSLTTVHAIGKKVNTEHHRLRKEGCNHRHTITRCSDSLRFDTDILNDETYSHPNLIVTI